MLISNGPRRRIGEYKQQYDLPGGRGIAQRVDLDTVGVTENENNGRAYLLCVCTREEVSDTVTVRAYTYSLYICVLCTLNNIKMYTTNAAAAAAAEDHPRGRKTKEGKKNQTKYIYIKKNNTTIVCV